MYKNQGEYSRRESTALLVTALLRNKKRPSKQLVSLIIIARKTHSC